MTAVYNTGLFLSYVLAYEFSTSALKTILGGVFMSVFWTQGLQSRKEADMSLKSVGEAGGSSLFTVWHVSLVRKPHCALHTVGI